MAKKNQVEYVTIDPLRMQQACDAFMKWKDLNNTIKNYATRGINMPEVISEPLGCWCLDLLWNRGSIVGDATNPKNNEKIEFKATSNFDYDLTSFGPKTQFDDLVFLRFNVEEYLLYVYDLHINSEEFGNIKVNATETVQNQKDEKRRPHVRMIEIFDLDNIEPNVIFDIMHRTFIKK